jgi:hypothetical protein
MLPIEFRNARSNGAPGRQSGLNLLLSTTDAQGGTIVH